MLMEFHMSLIRQPRKKIKKMTFIKFKIINQKRDNQNKYKNQKNKNKKGIAKSIKM